MNGKRASVLHAEGMQLSLPTGTVKLHEQRRRVYIAPRPAVTFAINCSGTNSAWLARLDSVGEENMALKDDGLNPAETTSTSEKHHINSNNNDYRLRSAPRTSLSWTGERTQSD